MTGFAATAADALRADGLQIYAFIYRFQRRISRSSRFRF
jgi:hypothetical protein